MSADRPVGGEPIEWWSCSHCGPHPNSRAGWCDMGCGSDYNRMALVRLSPLAVVGALARIKEQHDLFGRWFQPWPPRALVLAGVAPEVQEQGDGNA